MKALPMLDHVMLWVARGFIFFIAIATCYSVLFCVNALFIEDGTLVPPLGTIMAKSIAESVFFLACYLLIQKKISRLCLGLAAALHFIRTTFAASHRLGEIPYVVPSHMVHFLAITFLMYGIPLLGMASLIWISIRPPKDSKISNPNPIINSSLPQSC